LVTILARSTPRAIAVLKMDHVSIYLRQGIFTAHSPLRRG
jgi:hypothetical protein